ncbi:MAG: DUF5058 family protein [Synergistaceae bacterium]|nr:DUF5058 family protein [Synergistaceae bacterium]
MSPEVLAAANATGLWVISIIIVFIVLLQSVLYAKLSFKVAGQINYPISKCREALKAGMITAIGPSIAVFIVMVGMMAVVGTPITWLRLSIIGAAPTELTAATVGAQAAGVEFGSPQYDMHALSVSFWTMAINGTGWLVLVALFTHKLEDIRQKLGGGNAKWLGFLSLAAALGCFGYLNINTIVGALRNMPKNPSAVGAIYATVSGMAAMGAVTKLTQTRPWLKEYSLGIAMLIGMLVAAAFA